MLIETPEMPPEAVPFEVTWVTLEAAENWVSLERSRLMLWPLTPRPVDHLAALSPSPAFGAVAVEAPSVSVVDRVVLALSSVPSGLKATMPLSIRPGDRLGSVVTSDGGSARTSAYHWLAVPDFRKSTTTLRVPPLESDTGMVSEKSGFTPVDGSLAYSVMLTPIAGVVAGLTSAL